MLDPVGWNLTWPHFYLQVTLTDIRDHWRSPSSASTNVRPRQAQQRTVDHLPMYSQLMEGFVWQHLVGKSREGQERILAEGPCKATQQKSRESIEEQEAVKVVSKNFHYLPFLTSLVPSWSTGYCKNYISGTIP